MTLSSRTFAALDAFVTLATTAMPDVNVFDGPVPTKTAGQRYALIGVLDPDTPDVFNPAVDTGEQEWAALGALAKDETFVIPSVYVVWDGQKTFKQVRATAAADLALLDAACRADVNLGGTLLWSSLAIGQILQLASTKGPVVQVPFTVTCRARI